MLIRPAYALLTSFALILTLTAGPVGAQETATEASADAGTSAANVTNIKVVQSKVIGHIAGTNFTCTITLDVVSSVSGAILDVITGDVVVEQVVTPTDDHRLYYDGETKTYSLFLARKGAQRI